MKFNELKSIGHNIADSLASGIGLLIGVYETDVFGEAADSSEGYILVDFLGGTTSGGRSSASLARAVVLYSEALVELCRRHDTDVDTFQELTAKYSSDSLGPRFVVTVVDRTGRRSEDEYWGVPGRRAIELDDLGRARPKTSRS